MTNGVQTLFTLSLLSLVPGPGAAQVPAATEAYLWRGLDAEWGEWTHRLGMMGSYITSVDDSGYAIDVRGQLEGGAFHQAFDRVLGGAIECPVG